LQNADEVYTGLLLDFLRMWWLLSCFIIKSGALPMLL